MFTKGQSMQRHLRQYFASEHSLHSSLPKTLKLTPPELMRNTGHQFTFFKSSFIAAARLFELNGL
jgi:hypothetical protein